MDDWPVPREDMEVASAFGQTHVVVSGSPSAPPLVLLHGANTTSAVWRPIIAALSSSYRCFCIDTITDANKSVATKPVRRAEDYVSWLRQTLDALGVDTARLAGFSYGGWLAALFTLQAPERVSHLSVLGPAATLDPIPVHFFLRSFSTGLLRSPALADRFLQWMSATPNATSDPIMALIADCMTASRPLRREVLPPRVFSDADLGRLTVPVTVLIGDQDVVYRRGPDVALQRARTHIPNVHAEMLPGANHTQMLDCPDLVVTAMMSSMA
ncbi:alpha/beta hydrolase [Mycolicibacterium sp. 624]|uniref:alpha/beta fold hydrolase n=1 Tax=Mycolicibacterium sp. 624 TaxID=3156314 RepID=UPI003390A3E6